MSDIFPEGLTPRQVHSIAHLYELRFESEDLPGFISTSIEWITTCLECAGSAIQLHAPSLRFETKWITFQAPDDLIKQLDDPNSNLIEEVHRVYNSQPRRNAVTPNQISTILPLKLRGENVGIIILLGDSPTQKKIDFAEILLKAFARLIFSGFQAKPFQIESKEKELLKSVTESVNKITVDPNLTLYNFIKGIRRYFDAEYLLYLQKDPVTTDLIIKKLLDSDD